MAAVARTSQGGRRHREAEMFNASLQKILTRVHFAGHYIRAYIVIYVRAGSIKTYIILYITVIPLPKFTRSQPMIPPSPSSAGFSHDSRVPEEVYVFDKKFLFYSGKCESSGCGMSGILWKIQLNLREGRLCV